MANIRLGSIVADIRGGVGDEVYSRNQGGNYVRTPGTWVQPDTQHQLDCRGAITAVSQAWSATLTETQRDSWRAYGNQHVRPTRWGVRTLNSGYLWFLRSNLLHYREYSAIGFASAPIAAPLHRPEFTWTAEAAGDTATIALPPTNYDPTPGLLRLFLFIGQPVPAGRQYFSSPFRSVTDNTYTVIPFVNGDGNPSPNDDYTYQGLYQGKPFWKDSTSTYYIFFDTCCYYIWLGPPGSPPVRFWWNQDVLPWGTYQPVLGCSGNPVFHEHQWGTDPWTVNLPWPTDAGQALWAYIVAQDSAAGAISTRHTERILAGA